MKTKKEHTYNCVAKSHIPEDLPGKTIDKQQNKTKNDEQT